MPNFTALQTWLSLTISALEQQWRACLAIAGRGTPPVRRGGWDPQRIADLRTIIKLREEQNATRFQALHAARHTVSTELKELEVFEEHRNDALGHRSNPSCRTEVERKKLYPPSAAPGSCDGGKVDCALKNIKRTKVDRQSFFAPFFAASCQVDVYVNGSQGIAIAKERHGWPSNLNMI